ncbi:unnamed protein product [Tenebrio molitor]|nr:unnamed protein product [Tenebrio molitor]
MCKYLGVRWSKICVDYGGVVDVATGIALLFLKDFLIPLEDYDVHNCVIIAAAVFLLVKGSLLVVALRVGRKIRVSVLVYLVVTTVFILLAKGYTIYLGIKKFHETEQLLRYVYSDSMKFHLRGPILAAFFFICPTVFMLMWNLQLYLYLFYRSLSRSDRSTRML